MLRRKGARCNIPKSRNFKIKCSKFGGDGCDNIDNDEVLFRTRRIREGRLVRQLVIQSLLRSPLRVLLFIFLRLPFHSRFTVPSFPLPWPRATNRISLHCARFALEQWHKKEKLREQRRKRRSRKGRRVFLARQRLARREFIRLSSETLASHLINAFVNRQTRCGEWALMVTRSVGCWTKVPLRGRSSRRLRAKMREGERKRACVCNGRSALRLEIKRRNKWLIMRPEGGREGYKVGQSYSSALQLLPLQHTATLLYSTVTTKMVAERAGSSGDTLRRSEGKRKRSLSRNTKQPPTVPHHYSACRAQMLTAERIAVRSKEGVKINSFIRASHFSPSR